MLTDPSCAKTYEVRDVAPTALLFGNIGVVQATSMATAEVQGLVDAIGADALCVHLNPAQEAVQPGGDRDFRKGEDTFRRLTAELSVPVIAKETGCGISPSVGRRLLAAGLRDVDVSGAGGTSWVAVEAQRAAEPQRQLGERFWDWGIPTAASVALLAPLGFRTVIASGGMNHGLDAARAAALGADLIGMARPVLKALDAGGLDGLDDFLSGVEAELKTAMSLVGATNLSELRAAPRVLLEPLGTWLRQLGD